MSLLFLHLIRTLKNPGDDCADGEKKYGYISFKPRQVSTVSRGKCYEDMEHTVPTPFGIMYYKPCSHLIQA